MTGVSVRRQITVTLAVVVTTLAIRGSCADGQETLQRASGAVDFRVSCSAQAQAEFNRAVVLLHHMTYPRARESFEKAAQIDPQCAMAHWGIAMTLFQPLWPTRPGLAELRRGWEEVQTARRLNSGSERERLSDRCRRSLLSGARID